MDLLLQFGYGMMGMCRALVRVWGAGTTILSPRDLSCEQMERLSTELRSLPHGRVLVDPQFYLPHADHERLTSHDYWPADYATGGFWSGQELAVMLQSLANLNARLSAEAIILPGLLASQIEDDWLGVQSQIALQARALLPDQRLLATVALGADALRDTGQVGELLEAAEEWPVDGLYLVAEHPATAYIVQDPLWLANLLDIVAHNRLLGRRVVVGYCTHQMLLLASAGGRELASGTWMNVRSFPPGKFKTAMEDEVRQRATWYFCPQSLSEYKLSFLDIAQRQGVLALVQPDPSFGSSHADRLFTGVQPSTTTFDEPLAFKHYLHCFRVLATRALRPTFVETCDAHRQALDEAERLCLTLAASGVTGQLRDMADAIDANRAALAVLTSTRGPVLKRGWDRL